jgi:hypothetical protein
MKPHEKIKIVLEFEPYVAPPEPPPIRCDLCEQMCPAWDFGLEQYRPSGASICGSCAHDTRYKRWTAALNWGDQVFVFSAEAVVRHLKRQIANDRRYKNVG